MKRVRWSRTISGARVTSADQFTDFSKSSPDQNEPGRRGIGRRLRRGDRKELVRRPVLGAVRAGRTHLSQRRLLGRGAVAARRLQGARLRRVDEQLQGRARLSGDVPWSRWWHRDVAPSRAAAGSRGRHGHRGDVCRDAQPAADFGPVGHAVAAVGRPCGHAAGDRGGRRWRRRGGDARTGPSPTPGPAPTPATAPAMAAPAEAPVRAPCAPVGEPDQPGSATIHPFRMMTDRGRPETVARGRRTGRGAVTLMPEAPAPSEDEGTKVERPDAELADRRVAPPERAARQRWRTVLASLLIVVACVLAPLSAVAVWTKNLVTNTDRYVRTVAPLASEPAIQHALTDKITTKIFTNIDVQALYNQAVDALAKQGLPPNIVAQLKTFTVPVANGVQSFTHTEVAKITSSAAFANAWVQANRQAHAALVKALTGKGGGAVTIQNDTVTLNLGPLIHTAKQQLTASGFNLAAKIPETNATFALFQADNITKARGAFNLLNKLGIWLPIIALALIALGVSTAKNHRRALIGASLGVGAGMIVLALGLAIFRSAYLNALPPTASHDAAAVLYDTLVGFLRLGLRSVLVLALVIAVGAFLTGPSVTAVRTREGFVRGLGRLRGGAESAGLRTGPVGIWVYEHKQALRIGAVAAAGLALVFWGQPTGKVIILLAVLALVALALIELLARSPGATVSAPTPK